jgi:hypothetical protein
LKSILVNCASSTLSDKIFNLPPEYLKENLMKKLLFCMMAAICITAHAQTNYCLDFGGNQNGATNTTDDDYVTVSDNNALDITSSITIEAWIYRSGSSTVEQNIVDKSTGDPDCTYRFSVVLNKLGFWRASATQGELGNSDIPANQWVHVAMTLASGTLKFYINGVLDATITTVNTTLGPANNGLLYINNSSVGTGTTSTRYFHGKTDELRIWNVERTITEIKENIFNKNLGNAASGLVGYWTFNNGSGTTLSNQCTTTGSALNGSLVNSPGWTSSPVQHGGNALSFDGTNDYVSIPDNNTLDITTNITLEAWVYATKNSGIQNVMSKSSSSINTGYIFPRTDDGWANVIVYLHIGGSFQTLSAAYPSLNAWHHLAATYDGATMKIYINGTLSASRAQTGTITTNSNVLALGNQTGFSEYFGGYGDEFRLWNVARTQTEIQNGMNSELDPTAQTGLVSYYTINQGIAAGDNTGLITLIDHKGNNNGTLTSFSLSGASSNYVTQNSSLTVLPLKWLSFTVQKQNNQVSLNWSTASETNTKNFIVEHSINGINWHGLSILTAAGNSDNILSYNYTHVLPIAGINYYRIKQMDIDGNYSYSEIRSIRISNDAEPFKVVGNPIVNGKLQIQISQPMSQPIKLFSNDGRLIWTKQFIPGAHSVDVSQLMNGTYILKTAGYSEKILVQ